MTSPFLLLQLADSAFPTGGFAHSGGLEAAYQLGEIDGPEGLAKRLEPVRGCRGLGKKDMRLNDRTPKITVDPETYAVTADGERLTAAPAAVLPLAQRYYLF